jgi:hypothetical protein
MVLSDCQHDIFVSCLSQASRTKICGSQSFLGVSSHINLSLVSPAGFYPSSSSRCTLSWMIYGHEYFAKSVIIFERVLFKATISSLLFPNSQMITIFGNDFSASQAFMHILISQTARFNCDTFLFLQISFKIYDVTDVISVSQTIECSSTNFSRVQENIQFSLQNTKPAFEITDIRVQNESTLSFNLDSIAISSGIKIITAQADSQVHSMLDLFCSRYVLVMDFYQVFQQHLCFNITVNEHLTAKKLMAIMASHKENVESPFINENLLLKQQNIFSDINFVISSSASCTTKGISQKLFGMSII